MKRALRGLLALVILGAAVGVAMFWIRTRPQAKDRPQPPISAVVKVLDAQPSIRPAVVRGMGEVIAARDVVVQPEVSGRIVERHADLEPGGRIPAGGVIARIDPRDYEVARDQAEAALEKARFDLAVEQGRRTVAQEEWSRLGSEVPTSDAGRNLALREPHLRFAQSSLVAAESGLQKAMLNLERTSLTAPFDSVVIEKGVDVGQVVTVQSRVARMEDTSRFWVQASIPTVELPWFDPPAADGSGGAAATVIQDLGNGLRPRREGRVVRVLGDLDAAGRMARVLIEVERPLETAAGPPLLLGSFVEVELSGRPMSDVFELPRTALREGEIVWIMAPDDTLEFRPVSVIRRSPDTVIIHEGLTPGDRVVTDRIALPIPGMKLRLAGAGSGEGKIGSRDSGVGSGEERSNQKSGVGEP